MFNPKLIRTERICQNCCNRNIGALVNANRKYCIECSAIVKLEYNRQRQKIITDYGKQGLNNWKILNDLTRNGDSCPMDMFVEKLINRGFNFQHGLHITHNATKSKMKYSIQNYTLTLMDDNKTVRIIFIRNGK